jgi:hypothetical protein
MVVIKKEQKAVIITPFFKSYAERLVQSKGGGHNKGVRCSPGVVGWRLICLTEVVSQQRLQKLLFFRCMECIYFFFASIFNLSFSFIVCHPQ